jgi:vacuolar-type H+-ATPase subunit H
VAEAQKRADYISSNDNIVKIASQKADALMAEAKERSARIVAEAQKRAEELKASSQRWCLENLQSLVETLKKLESTTQGGIENIKFKQKQNINQKNGGK